MTVKADTIEALAKEIGVPEANLKATVDSWNKYVEAKNDTEFGRATGMDRNMTKAPFYAIKIAPGIHHTMGGLKINVEDRSLERRWYSYSWSLCSR